MCFSGAACAAGWHGPVWYDVWNLRLSSRVNVWWLPPVWRRVHPFLLLVSIPLAARALGLLFYDFDSDPAGHPIVPSPLTSPIIAVPYHLLVLAPVAALGLLAWTLLPQRRAAVAGVWTCLASLSVLVGETDRQMLRLLGHGLSLSTVRAYAGPSVFAAEVLEPLLRDWSHVASPLGVGARSDE